MNDFQKDVTRMRELLLAALTETEGLAAVQDAGAVNQERMQRKLEQTMEKAERSIIELRQLAERHSPGVGGYGDRYPLKAREVTGSVNMLEYTWLHITLNTLLPHCRFQSPNWLSDTIRRLLDSYEGAGGQIPYFKNGAVLVIDEYSDIEGRHIYDQDNKGWKAVSNAIKGRVVPDDDQYSLAVILMSARSRENVTHITLMDKLDAGDFLSRRCGYAAFSDVYGQL